MFSVNKSVNKVESGAFNKAIASINEILEASEEMCNNMWQANHEECMLRNNSDTEGVIMCGYPERINSTRENNCKYEVCPLIRRLYV